MKKILLYTSLIVMTILIACSGDKPQSSGTSKAVKSAKSSSVEKKETYKMKKTESESKKAVASKSSEAEEDQTEPMTKEQLDKAKNLIKKAGDVSDVDGKKLFKMNCTSCHGLKGNLKINGAKDLSKSKINLENAVAQVYFGKGLMTSYSQILSEKEIVAVAKYTETLRR